MKLVDMIAKAVADGIVSNVDTNTEDFLETLDVDALIEQELQELPANIYEEVADLIPTHPDVLAAISQCVLIIEEHRIEAIEWAKGPMHFYGLKESDFR